MSSTAAVSGRGAQGTGSGRGCRTRPVVAGYFRSWETRPCHRAGLTGELLGLRPPAAAPWSLGVQPPGFLAMLLPPRLLNVCILRPPAPPSEQRVPFLGRQRVWGMLMTPARSPLPPEKTPAPGVSEAGTQAQLTWVRLRSGGRCSSLVGRDELPPPAHGSAGTYGRPGPFREVNRRAVKTQGLRATCTGVSAASVLSRAADTSRSLRPERPAPWGEATAQGCLRAKDSTRLTPAASWAVSCSREASVDNVQDPTLGLAWSQRPTALASVMGVPGKKKGRFWGEASTPHFIWGCCQGICKCP